MDLDQKCPPDRLFNGIAFFFGDKEMKSVKKMRIVKREEGSRLDFPRLESLGDCIRTLAWQKSHENDNRGF